jgi:ABC-2 type transport system permease protein
MGPIFAIAFKDLRQLLRDRSAAFFTLGFPLLVAMFFGMIFGNNGSERGQLALAVVNLDTGRAGASFVQDLSHDDSVKVTPVADRATGEELVRKGKVTACVVVPATFSQDASGMFAGKAMKLEAVVDPSHQAEAGLLTGKLNELAFKQMSKVFADPAQLTTSLGSAREAINASSGASATDKALFGLMFDAIEKVSKRQVSAKAAPAEPAPDQKAKDPKAAEQKESADAAADDSGTPMGGWRPVEVSVHELEAEQSGPRSGYEVSFAQGVIWGLMGCVTAFGSSIAAERTRGTLTRLTIAPVTRSHVLAGKALACFIACMVVQALLLVFGMLVFRIRIGNPALMALACVSGGIGFTGVMMFMAGMSRTEGGGSGMGRAVVLVLAMIGGGTVPLFILPKFMQTVSKISPFSWASTCLEGAIWREFTFSDMLFPCGVLVAFGIAGFAIGVSTMKWSE